MKKLVILFLLSLLSGNLYSSSFASQFVIDLESDVGDLDIGVSTFQAGNTAIVALENRTQQMAYCRTMFHNGPEVPRRRKNKLEQSENVILSYTAKRSVIRMKIQVHCASYEAD